MHIALTGQFASWAGRLIGLDRKIILVAEDRDAMLEAFTRLARVGMEHVVGYLEDGMTAWFREGLPVEQVPQVTVQDLYREIEHVQIIDVRQPGEWEQMHIAQAVLKPLPKLTTMLEGIDRERPDCRPLQVRLSQLHRHQPVEAKWLHGCDECDRRHRRLEGLRSPARAPA